jgi:hypothetical protein
MEKDKTMKKNALHTTQSAVFGIPAKILAWLILGLLGSILLLGQVYGEPSEALFIDADGNVGIGTNTPAAKLDVKGTLNTQSLEVAEKIGTGNLEARGKITAQEVQVAGSVSAARVNVAGVINAQKITAQGTIDFSPHWDSGWLPSTITYPRFAITQNHNLGVIPSRYTLQYKSQSAPNEVYVLNGGSLVQLALNAAWRPSAQIKYSVQYAGPFHFYPTVKFNASQVKLEAYLVPLKPKDAKVSLKMLGLPSAAAPKVDITELPFQAGLSPPGAFRILLWK